MAARRLKPPPTLLKPKEISALYDALETTQRCLEHHGIPYVLVAGSLLGAVRSRSLLFCDDDADIAVFEEDYAKVLEVLPAALRNGGHLDEDDSEMSNDSAAVEPRGVLCSYTKRPWPAADKIRPMSQTQMWVDVFVLKRFENRAALASFVGTKANGQPQPPSYVARILDAIDVAGNGCPGSTPYPLWHYDAPKAIEEWPKEFFTSVELYPLHTKAFGPLHLPGPAHPVPYLLRAYGASCFVEYVVAEQHIAWRNGKNNNSNNTNKSSSSSSSSGDGGGNSSDSGSSSSSPGPFPLEHFHYLPIPHGARSKRDQVASGHTRTELQAYLMQENVWAVGAKYTAPLVSAFAIFGFDSNRAPGDTIFTQKDLALSTQPSLSATSPPNPSVVDASTPPPIKLAPSPSSPPTVAKAYRPTLVKVNGFGAVVAALTDYRTGLLFSANELQPLSKELVCHSPLPRPPVQEYARQEDAQLLAVMEPFVAKARAARARADDACSTAVFAALGGLNLDTHEEATSSSDAIPKASNSAAGFQALTRETRTSYDPHAHPLASTLADALYGRDTTTQIHSATDDQDNLCRFHDLIMNKEEDAAVLRGLKQDTSTYELSGLRCSVNQCQDNDVITPDQAATTSATAIDEVKALKHAKTKAMNRLRDVDLRASFHNTFEAFVAEVVLPSVAKDWDRAAEVAIAAGGCSARAKRNETAAVAASPGLEGLAGRKTGFEGRIAERSEGDRLSPSDETPDNNSNITSTGQEDLPADNKEGEWLSECWVQSFPCVRVLTPGEFSLPPHCDSAYGHPACCINFTVPLTTPPPAAALHVESAPGREDWHPLLGGLGSFTRFWGARCLHWTSENTDLDTTRVSLDFRIVPSRHLWNCLVPENSDSDAAGRAPIVASKPSPPSTSSDPYGAAGGYYAHFVRPHREAPWVRVGLRPEPDKRMGFPFVKS